MIKNNGFEEFLISMKERIDRCSPKKHDYQYEERLVAYIDILGWKDRTSNNEINDDVKSALMILDEEFFHLDNGFKASLAKELGKDNVNSIAQDMEIGFFSDGFIMSMPIGHGGRIFEVNKICRQLLTLEFLCRGAIAVGYCYHRGNRVVGPAINQVVQLERKANFPIILCTDQVVQIANKCKMYRFITDDLKKERKVLNLFATIVKEESDEMRQLNKELREDQRISNIMDKNIERHEKNLEKLLEKLALMQDDITLERKKLFKWQYAKLLMQEQLDYVSKC